MTRTSKTSKRCATRSTTSTPSWADALTTSPPPDALWDRLGYAFRDPALLNDALTHRSWCAENASETSNERIEFLGDSVLGLVVTDYIYAEYPHLSEGKLAKLRATVVSSVTLAKVARALELGGELRLGKGELSSGGTDKSSILADAMEAVIGAVYLDGGWDPANKLVLSLMQEHIEASAVRPGREDFKTRLQEYAARHFEAMPIYDVASEGPDHEKRFSAAVSIAGTTYGTGVGRNKKEAEQASAAAAWDHVVAETRPATTTEGDPVGPPNRTDTVGVTNAGEAPAAGIQQ